MVWGMPLPNSNFGEFWPEGDLENNFWSNRLRDHHAALSAEAQKRLFDWVDVGQGYDATHAYPGYVAAKFKREIGATSDSGDPPVASIKPHEPPKSLDLKKTYESLGSMIMLESRLLAVDEDLKDVIERLEPGAHQFFPLEIRSPKSQTYPKSYYTLVIGKHFDSFSPEKSQEGAFRQRNLPGHYYFSGNKQKAAGHAFRQSVFGGAHLWRERRFDELLTNFSNDLQREMVKAGLRIPKHFKMKEV